MSTQIILVVIFFYASFILNAVIAPSQRRDGDRSNASPTLIIEAPAGKNIKVLASTPYVEYEDIETCHELLWSQDELGRWHVMHSRMDREISCIYGASGRRKEIVLELLKTFSTNTLSLIYSSDIEITYVFVDQSLF